MSLPSSMADFVPCDRLLQKAYSALPGERERQRQIANLSQCPIFSFVTVLTMINNVNDSRVSRDSSVKYKFIF